MKKSHIVNNIGKYYLNGLTKEVVWNLVGGKATIDFATETKDAIGTVTFDMSLPDGPLAIYSTDALLRLIGITSEEIQIELSKGPTGLVDKLKWLVHTELFLNSKGGKSNLFANDTFSVIDSLLNIDFLNGICSINISCSND